MPAKLDIKIGTRFNKLVTLEEIDRTTKPAKVLCKCDCGNIKKISLHGLTTVTKSCGCRGMTVLIGDKFGRWTAIQKSFVKNSITRVLCQCECGTIKEFILGRLTSKSNPSLSCGCYRKDFNTKHGLKETRIYRIYTTMKSRCYNKNRKGYTDYGARGITICDEWRNNFQAFYDWAMANEYQEHLEIDRIDVNGNYEPSNCRWITSAQNSYNKRGSKNSSSKYKGVTKVKNKWVASIGYQNKRYYLGRFKNEDDAALAYNEKAKELFGEYAYINKIIPSHPTENCTENPHKENL